MGNDGFDARSGLYTAWHNILDFVPDFLGFLVILVLGYIIAQALGTATTKLLRRVGFNGVIERGGMGTVMARSSWDASMIVGRVVFFTVMLFALQMAFGVFGANPISNLLTRTIAFLPNVFVALAILVISGYIASFVKTLVQATIGGLSYGKFLATLAGVAVMTIGVFAALDQLEIAPQIVMGLWYGMLAIICGSAIIAIGGGGILPMRNVWERTMRNVENEIPRVKEQVATATAQEPVAVGRDGGAYTA